MSLGRVCRCCAAETFARIVCAAEPISVPIPAVFPNCDRNASSLPSSFASRNANRARNLSSSSVIARRAFALDDASVAFLLVSALDDETVEDDDDSPSESSFSKHTPCGSSGYSSGMISGARYRASAVRRLGSSSANPNHPANVSSNLSRVSSHETSAGASGTAGSPPVPGNAVSYAGFPSPEGATNKASHWYCSRLNRIAMCIPITRGAEASRLPSGCVCKNMQSLPAGMVSIPSALGPRAPVARRGA